MPYDFAAVKKALYRGWSARTSVDSDKWSRRGPAWGQCVVSALYAQDKLGGQIVRVEYATPDGLNGSHYVNLLPDHGIYDATAEQFPEGTTFNPPLTERPLTLLQITQDYVMAKQRESGETPDGDTRAYLLSNQSTKERYDRLLKNMERFAGCSAA